MYDFKKFTSRNAKTDDRISIGGKSYSIGLPTQFVNNNGLRSFKFAVLYFDKAKLAIGIQFVNEPGSDRFAVMHSKEGYGANIVARSFFRINQVNPSEYKHKYEWKKYLQEGVGELFVIELSRLVPANRDADSVVSSADIVNGPEPYEAGGEPKN